FLIKTEKPGLDQITRRLSEEQLYEVWRQDYRKRPGLGRIYFPEEEPVSKDAYTGRQSPYMVKLVEPNYVIHGQLYFESRYLERYGWNIGPLSPVVEAGFYYYALVMLPYRIGANANTSFA